MNFNRAYINRNMRRDTFDLYLSRVTPNRSVVEVVSNVMIEQVDAHSSLNPDEPGIRMEREAAQLLMDDLWVSGIRPTHAKAGDDLIEALRAHVTDACAVRDGLMEHLFMDHETP